MNKKIIILCPGGITTGGPELLHQLAHTLCIQGIDASVCYYPLDQNYQTPIEYLKYNVKTTKFHDDNNTIIVIPESATALSKHAQKSKVIIWWLSVDNYLGWKKESLIIDKARHIYQLIKGKKLALRNLKTFHHLAQSDYAREFLEKNGIQSMPLSDYISKDHFTLKNSKRDNIIAFNPKKGRLITRAIIKKNPDLKFVPLQGMTSQQINDVLSRAKLYIDFGNHPGKDRLPREAALAGCCIITGKKGSANNDIDIPIEKKYKINERDKNFFRNFRNTVDDIFYNFEDHTTKFESYRRKIESEERLFSEQAGIIFSALTK